MIDFIVDLILRVIVEVVVWSDCVLAKFVKGNK